MGVEDAIGEPVLPEVLPDVLDWVELWGPRGQEDQRHVPGHNELFCGVPAGAIEQQHGMGAALDVSADLMDVELHGEGIGKRQRQAGTFPLGGTDGAE